MLAAGCMPAPLDEEVTESEPAQREAQAETLADHPHLLAAYLQARQREGGPAYELEASAELWRGRNAAHQFALELDGDAVRIEAGSATFGLRLAGLGLCVRAQRRILVPAAEAHRQRRRGG